VIRLETPGDRDPLRKWRMLHNGTSVWWPAQSRNKQSVCIDLRRKEGRALVRKFAETAEVLIGNFRPGGM
jgi:formyl-CoA transferase